MPPKFQHMQDESVSDLEWWGSDYAEFEDFVGIGERRVRTLVSGLRMRGESEFVVNRLLRANGLPHGPCNKKEKN